MTSGRETPATTALTARIDGCLPHERVRRATITPATTSTSARTPDRRTPRRWPSSRQSSPPSTHDPTAPVPRTAATKTIKAVQTYPAGLGRAVVAPRPQGTFSRVRPPTEIGQLPTAVAPQPCVRARVCEWRYEKKLAHPGRWCADSSASGPVRRLPAGQTEDVALEIAAAAALVAVVVAAATVGWRSAKIKNSKKMDILSTFDGQDVILWLSFGGSVQTVVPRRGRLRVDDADRSSVVLIADEDRLVFLDQIRWIEDPRTGKRFGDRWHGKLHSG